MGWSLGVDIGGTFIDFCALDPDAGRLVTTKVLTTPGDPGAELIEGLERLAEEGVDPAAVARFVHGTTVGINTVIQRRGAPLALLTNRGFEDVVELARLRMPDMYSLFCARPDPLIPRDRVFGIAGRIVAGGAEAEPLDLGEIAGVVDTARERGGEGIVVALLHAYANPAHEDAVKAEIARLAPDLFVFTSAEVWPVIREYERTTTAILNGYVHPRVASYLAGLRGALTRRGVGAPPLLTKSSGGLMDAADGDRGGVHMLLSGTASGVVGAAWLARQSGEANVLTLDIGGTSADIAVILDGAPQFGTGEMVGEFPLYIPSVSVSSIGIGGGSIVRLGEDGLLRVGPESAGSDPGPACYGRGGTEPTVTDAVAALGALGHAPMAYGALTIDVAKARAALAPVAERLGRSIEATADAVLDVAVAEMLVEVEKLASRAAVDLRDFTLLPFGGGGPMLACRLAREIGARRVLTPERPGVLSALGGLVAELRCDVVRTVMVDLAPPAMPALAEAAAALAAEGEAWVLERQPGAVVATLLSAEMRYHGQSFEIDVALPSDAFAKGDVGAIAARFHEAHRDAYAFDDPEGEIEIVSLRLVAAAEAPPLALPPTPLVAGAAAATRTVDLFEAGAVRPVPLHLRDDLAPGATLQGPAIVAQADTTLLVPTGMAGRVDGHRNLVLEFAPTAAMEGAR